jgi:hypothetical protein
LVICGVLVNSAPLEDDLNSQLLQEIMTKQEAKGGYGFPFHKQLLYGKREINDLLPSENMNKPEESGYGYGAHYLGKREVDDNFLREKKSDFDPLRKKRYFGKREVNENLFRENMTKQEAKGAYPFHKQRLYGKREINDLLHPDYMTKPDYAGRKHRERFIGKRAANENLLRERMAKQEAKGGYGSPFHKQRLYGKREVDDWLLPENMNKPEESGYGYAGRKQRERYFGKREVNSQLDLAKNFDRGKKMKILVKARSFVLNFDPNVIRVMMIKKQLKSEMKKDQKTK